MEAQKNERPVILKVEGAGKKYIIKNLKKPPENATRLQMLKYNMNKFKKRDFWALRNISFEVHEGDRLAVVGRNGAGKSTLLKLITRITEPTEGRIEYYGKIAAMLEVGTGFNLELTGRENVYLNGAILGMSRQEIDERFDGIVDFSEIGDFIDTPVKRYSSGMLVRLAFAVASTMDPDILIIDEVLSVGDMKFREKCLNRMNEIARTGKTIICVSHVMNILRGLCDRAIMLEQGKMVYNGDVEEAIRLYYGTYETQRNNHVDYHDKSRPKTYPCNYAKMASLDILDNDECVYKWNEPIHFVLNVDCFRDVEKASVRVTFKNESGAPVSTAFFETNTPLKAGEPKSIFLSIDQHNLAPGNYTGMIDLTMNDPHDSVMDLDTIRNDAFFITVKRFERENDNQFSDNDKVWLNSWGNSRIPEVSTHAIENQ